MRRMSRAVALVALIGVSSGCYHHHRQAARFRFWPFPCTGCHFALWPGRSLQVTGDAAVSLPSGLGQERRADDLGRVGPSRQARCREEHLRRAAGRTTRSAPRRLIE